METVTITKRTPEMGLRQLLRDSQEDLAMTGDLEHKVLADSDRMVMPIEAVVSMISSVTSRAGMITELKIPLIETALPLDSIKVSSAERLFTTLRRPTKHFRSIVPASSHCTFTHDIKANHLQCLV
jgi:hypothetical protein